MAEMWKSREQAVPDVGVDVAVDDTMKSAHGVYIITFVYRRVCNLSVYRLVPRNLRAYSPKKRGKEEGEIFC